MKKLKLTIAVIAISIAVFSCSKTDPTNQNGPPPGYIVIGEANKSLLKDIGLSVAEGRTTYKKAKIWISENIDMTTERVFFGIGDSGDSFEGIIDGNNKTITVNLDQVGNNVGFVNNLKNGTIKNLTIAGTISAAASDNVGGIAAYAENSTIENCINKATVSGASYVGGIVGRAKNPTTIKNCINKAAVSGKSYVGGIVGESDWDDSSSPQKNQIINCYNAATIKGNPGVKGSIAGRAEKSTLIGCGNYPGSFVGVDDATSSDLLNIGDSY